MIDWLFGLRDRLKVGVGRWYPQLPAIACAVVLLPMTVGGIWRGGSEGGVPAMLAAFVPAISEAARSCLGVPLSRPYQQGVETGKDLPRDQVASLTPLKVSKTMPVLLQLQGNKPLVVDSLASLSLTGASRMPGTIVNFDGEDRKKIFINLLLPTIMVALDEVRQERRQLLGIIAELGRNPADVVFSEGQTDWQQRLGGDKTKFVLGLTRKYRSLKADELLDMVNVLPPSLVIAQGALESSWGGSRIATEVNNLFGMFSDVDSGISAGQDGGRTPRIMEYDSILESVRAYVLNINRLSAYKELRRIRCQTLDPLQIADGLLEYSERKELYIKDVKHIIAGNNLQDYDTLILSAG